MFPPEFARSILCGRGRREAGASAGWPLYHTAKPRCGEGRSFHFHDRPCCFSEVRPHAKAMPPAQPRRRPTPSPVRRPRRRLGPHAAASAPGSAANACRGITCRAAIYLALPGQRDRASRPGADRLGAAVGARGGKPFLPAFGGRHRPVAQASRGHGSRVGIGAEKNLARAWCRPRALLGSDGPLPLRPLRT
jgi:hypothetical protein